MEGRTPRAVAALCAAIVAALTAAVGVHAATRQPPSLDGLAVTPDTASFTGTCDPDHVSTITFHVTGHVSGPVDGTLDETATATIAAGHVTDFSSSFTIDGRGFHVAGTRTADPESLPTSLGFCGEVAWGYPNGIVLDVRAQYAATFTGRLGNGVVTGDTGVYYGDVGSRSTPAGMTAFEFRLDA
ncbi:MAG TPA: hypothetical protein VI408_10300 [Gaiellaceae bacterium]